MVLYCTIFANEFKLAFSSRLKRGTFVIIQLMRRLNGLLVELEDFGVRQALIQPGLPELGSDLAMPCFSLAQARKLAPQAIAEEIATNLAHAHIERVMAVNGYLNIWLSARFLAENLLDWQGEQKDLGQKEPNGHRVLIEYFSPNLAKPISAGHLRNLFQGRALSNLHAVMGYEVITDNHIGDWGTNFGIWLVGFLKYGQKENLKRDGLKELGRIYVLIRRDLKNEAAQGKTDLKDQVQAWFLKLEAGDDEAWQYHELFSQISRREIDVILDDLEIEFDETLGESFYLQDVLGLLEDLEDRKVAERQADKSLIADLNSEGIEVPLLIQKSNGATLYATRDIATMAYRQKRWQLDKVVYVVGMEQSFYFKQLFAFNRIAKLTSAELIHHAFGLVQELNLQGKKQKMSSRTEAVHLEDVLKRARVAAKKMANKELSDEDIKKIAESALIFQEFSQGKKHDILFDWQRIFSFSEMSGPYVQYAGLRLKSILQKADIKAQPDFDYDWRAEHKLIIKVLSFEDVLEFALKSSELNKVALHVFELCKELNRYYEETRVLDGDPSLQASRLWLMDVIYRHLCFALSILGMKMPSKM